jgi:hypothetical protein
MTGISPVGERVDTAETTGMTTVPCARMAPKDIRFLFFSLDIGRALYGAKTRALATLAPVIRLVFSQITQLASFVQFVNIFVHIADPPLSHVEGKLALASG